MPTAVELAHDQYLESLHPGYVTVEEAARIMGVTSRTVTREIAAGRFSAVETRLRRRTGKDGLGIPRSEAEAWAEQRRGRQWRTTLSPDARGWVYLIQLMPDLSERRVKIGFAVNLRRRIGQHRVSCPTLRLLRAWPAEFQQEAEFLALVRSTDGNLSISDEVFDFSNLGSVIEDGNRFFRTPAIESLPPLRKPRADVGTEEEARRCA